jgi:hypothetical protein
LYGEHQAECGVAIFGFSPDTSIALLTAGWVIGIICAEVTDGDVDQRGVTGATIWLKRLQAYA